MSDDDNGVLSDHRRYKTTFTPPFLDDLEQSLDFVSWIYEFVPEVLWVELLFESCGPQRAVEITLECAEVAQDLFGERHYVYSCDYDNLSDEEFQELRGSLKEETISQLTNALAPLAYHYPTFPQSRLIGVPDDFDPETIDVLQNGVHALSDRHTRPATIVQATYVYVLIVTGILVVGEGMGFDNFEDIMDYPETDESRQLGAVIRATTKANRASREDDEQSDWMRRFWKRGFEITDCLYPQQLGESDEGTSNESIPDQEFFEGMINLGWGYEEELLTSLVDLWRTAEKDPEFSGKSSVLDGLLMRQVSLVTKVAENPSLWNSDLSGIILRCMADIQITMEWFNKVGEKEDYESFIVYGLGQQKLNLEHQFSMLSRYEEYEGIEDIEMGLEEAKRALEEQRYTFLLPVDVGKWNKSTRQMAQEADCKEELYDLRFSFHSGTTHGMWHALEQQHLVKCQNSLHKYHRIPNFNGPVMNPITVIEAGNLMTKSLDSWIEARNADPEGIDIPDLAGTVKPVLSEYRGIKV